MLVSIGARHADPRPQQQHVALRAGEIVIAAAARGRWLSPRAGHDARLTAVSRLVQMLAAGRPIAKAAKPKR